MYKLSVLRNTACPATHSIEVKSIVLCPRMPGSFWAAWVRALIGRVFMVNADHAWLRIVERPCEQRMAREFRRVDAEVERHWTPRSL